MVEVKTALLARGLFATLAGAGMLLLTVAPVNAQTLNEALAGRSARSFARPTKDCRKPAPGGVLP
jgi:hypothetical protein